MASRNEINLGSPVVRASNATISIRGEPAGERGAITGPWSRWEPELGSSDLEALAAHRDQLFAEAVHLYKSGVKWWPDKDFELEHIKPEQDARKKKSCHSSKGGTA